MNWVMFTIVWHGMLLVLFSLSVVCVRVSRIEIFYIVEISSHFLLTLTHTTLGKSAGKPDKISPEPIYLRYLTGRHFG
jgi:hypothetical protein